VTRRQFDSFEADEIGEEDVICDSKGYFIFQRSMRWRLSYIVGLGLRFDLSQEERRFVAMC
jgi:hypothetical protein